MKAPLVSLLPILAFALSPLERASAIAMGLSFSWVDSSALSAGNFIGDMDHRSAGEGSTLPVAVTISPLNLGLTVAASSWSFVNTPTQAIWSGAQTLNNFGAVSPFSSRASASSELRFTLGETVTYSVTGSFLADLNDGATARSGALLGFRATEERVPPIYTEIDTTTGTPFGFNQFGDGVGSIAGTNTGILAPGAYLFRFVREIRDGNGGSGNGSFALTLTRSVPDAGSTLTLLGLALCAIGGIFRKVHRA